MVEFVAKLVVLSREWTSYNSRGGETTERHDASSWGISGAAAAVLERPAKQQPLVPES